MREKEKKEEREGEKHHPQIHHPKSQNPRFNSLQIHHNFPNSIVSPRYHHENLLNANFASIIIASAASQLYLSCFGCCYSNEGKNSEIVLSNSSNLLT